MSYTHFTIGNEQYCFKQLFYGISIGSAAFASILTHFLYPLIRKGTVITYVDDIFIQTTSYEKMFETLTEYHKILLKENLKAAPGKSYFMLKKVKFLGHIIEDKKVKPLTSRIDGFQKLEPPNQYESITEIPRNNKFPCEIRLRYATNTSTIVQSLTQGK